MRNKNKTILALLAIIFLFSNFLCYGDELIVKEGAWEEPNVYRPNPLLFLHGFAAGAAKSWDNVIEQMQTEVSDDKRHFDKYYIRKDAYGNPLYGQSFGNKKPYLEIIQFFNASSNL